MSINNGSIPALEVNQVNVNYDKTPVLWDVSLSVSAGNLVGIVGPNGAGKSTLIKTAMGLVKPISGSIRFFGKPLSKVREKVGYVPQRESVDWDFPITVLELVLMGRYGRLGLLKWPKKQDVEKAMHYLQLVGMHDFSERQISKLSGGQQQRVFLARALLQEADLYFMDEPFSGIDMATEKIIMDLLKQLKDAGKTVLVVHHDLNSVKTYFNWIIMLNMRLVGAGPVDEVFTREMIDKTYGRLPDLIDEVSKISV